MHLGFWSKGSKESIHLECLLVLIAGQTRILKNIYPLVFVKDQESRLFRTIGVSTGTTSTEFYSIRETLGTIPNTG